MAYFTFERRRRRRGETAFDGDVPVGEVYAHKPLRERLRMDERPARYLAKLPSGAWLPGQFLSRHDAAEALRAYWWCEQYEEQVAG